MNNDIGKIVSECLNKTLIQNMLIKKRNMNIDEKIMQEENFSRMIGYCILFKESEGIEEYMYLDDEDKQINFLKRRIAKKIGISENEIDNRIEEIIGYAFENFIKDGYVFHAGNSKTIKNNMKNGLGVSETSSEDKLELMTIDSIFAKYGKDHPLGWAILDINNNKDGWFFDGTPSHMLYYADSPEWFGQFCGGNHCYAYGLVPEEYRHGYANRDYDTCLLAVTKLIEKNNMNATDKKIIIDFFNKCWKLYGDTEPYLAFVPISNICDDDIIDDWKSDYFPSLAKKNELYLSENSIFKDIIKGGCLGINEYEDTYVPANRLSCVNLSPILPRFKVNENTNNREMTIQECISILKGLDMDSLNKAREMLSKFSEVKEGGKKYE